MFTSLLWSQLCCGNISILLNFQIIHDGSPVARTLHPDVCLWLLQPERVFLYRSSSSSSSPLSHVASVPPDRTARPALAPQPPETAGALQPEPADKRHQRKKLASPGSSPHDRDKSLGGWEEEFEKTDKCSFIATYLKQLITYGR